MQNTEVDKVNEANESSIVNKTVFEHRHHIQTCVDSGFDCNIMDENAIEEIIRAGAEV